MGLLCLALSVGVATSARPVSATPVVSFNEATGGNATNQGQSVGWQFDVLSPLSVTGPGWFDEGANGLGHQHTVGIWDSSGTLLTSVLVPSGTAAGLDGQFRTVSVAPLVLPVGDGYIVGGENFSDSGDRLADNVAHTVDPRVRYSDATFSSLGAGFTRPANFSLAVTGFYGPAFSLAETAPVPEPGTLTLLGAGILGLSARRRKKTNGLEVSERPSC